MRLKKHFSEKTGSNMSPKGILIAAWLLATIPLLGFWAYGLFDMDEGFYASVTSAMLRRHDWLIPYYNGQPWFEKPILLYWFTAPSLWAFGGEFGLRLPSVLSTLALAGVLYAWGKRHLSPASGLLAMLVYATSLLVVLVGRMMLTDALFVLFLSLGFLTFYDSLVGQKRLRLWSAFFLGLAVLAKGPIALVFFGLLAGLTYWKERDLRSSYRGYWLLGVLIFFVTVATWYLPATLADPKTFIQQFFIEQNFKRFLGGDTVHRLPSFWLNLIFFPVVLFVGMLPWSIWVFKATSPSSLKDSTFLRYLTRWGLVVLVLFTISGSKLPHYILPAVPAFALVLGDWVGRRKPQSLPGAIYNCRLVMPGICSVLIFLLSFGGMYWYYGTGERLNQEGQLRAIAKKLSAQDIPLATYQMGKRSGDESKGKLSMLATNQPSLVFYFGHNVLEFEDFKKMLQIPKPLWVITRPGRFIEQDFIKAKKAHQELIEYPLALWIGHPVDAPKFEVFLLSKKRQ